MRVPLHFEENVFRRLPLGCLLAASVAGFAFGTGWSARAAAVPWLVSLVIVGLPHGAADLAIARRLGGTAAALRLFAGYIAVMGLVFGGFVFFPVPLVLLFTAVSIWHFGMAHADCQSPPIAAALWPRMLAAVARGAPVIGVPLACFPAETCDIVARLLALTGGGAAATPLAPAVIRMAGFLLMAAAGAALLLEAVASSAVPGAARRSLATLVDLAAITAVGATTDPLFSVGLYFLCWHAWRHLWLLAPLVAAVRPTNSAALGRAILRLHLAALPLLVPTWAALLGAWWWLSPHHSPRDLAILSLAVYLVVTPSHDLLIDLLRARSAAGRSRGEAAAARHRATAIPPSCAARLASSSP
jgi:Brp/Blh family beta-carotene 15,15'-monooxygenase